MLGLGRVQVLTDRDALAWTWVMVDLLLVAAQAPPKGLAHVVDGGDAGAVDVGAAGPGADLRRYLIDHGAAVLRGSVSVHNTLLFYLSSFLKRPRPIRVVSEMAR